MKKYPSTHEKTVIEYKSVDLQLTVSVPAIAFWICV